MTDTNYHTHHQLCQHATGSTEDYVKEAIRLGFKELGMSDHVPSDLLPDTMRMTFNELASYYEDVRTQQKAYQDRIQVFLGMECEFLDSNPSYYETFLHSVDYLILGQHYILDRGRYHSAFNLSKPHQIERYGLDVVKAIKSGLFSMVAHPDLYMCGYDAFDESAKAVAHQILQAAEQYEIPIELNANGIRRGIKQTVHGPRYPYPREEFWDIAQSYTVDVILNSDAHAPRLLYDDAMKKAEAMMQDLNLTHQPRLKMKHLKNRL